MPSDIAEREVMIVDPMLATGGSASAAIRFLKDRGVTNIKSVHLLAAPEGIKRLNEDHPDVEIYIAGLDENLTTTVISFPVSATRATVIFGTK